jgi:hypothetical protein
MRALLRSSALSLCLVWSLPQAGQAETVAQLLAGASARHGELFRVDNLEGHLVFVDGLNEIWRLTDEGTLAARATAMVDQDMLHLLWQDGHGQSVELDRDLAVHFTGDKFALAEQLQIITTGQLGKATDALPHPLPAGLRFDVDGTLYSAAPTVYGRWALEGAGIVITPSEGEAFAIAPADLAAAITATTESSPNE